MRATLVGISLVGGRVALTFEGERELAGALGSFVGRELSLEQADQGAPNLHAPTLLHVADHLEETWRLDASSSPREQGRMFRLMVDRLRMQAQAIIAERREPT